MKNPVIFALATTALHQAAFSQAPTTFENPVVLSAQELIPAEWMQGPSHRVREQVVTDGFMAHFTIDTDFGSFEAAGVPEVHRRIVETNAIRKLTDTSKGDLFAEGMKRSIERPIDAVKNIVTHPVDSVKQAPKTVGHFFSKIGSSIERSANRIKQEQESGEEVSASQTAGRVNESMKRAAGFDKARLDTARQLSVDPYSDNQRLQDEIDTVTWAFFAGGLPLRIGAAVASAGVAVTATNLVGVPEDAYAHTQSELALMDAQSLTAMGVREADIKTFQIQPVLSTTRRHRIVKSLEALSHAKGRETSSSSPIPARPPARRTSSSPRCPCLARVSKREPRTMWTSRSSAGFPAQSPQPACWKSPRRWTTSPGPNKWRDSPSAMTLAARRKF